MAKNETDQARWKWPFVRGIHQWPVHADVIKWKHFPRFWPFVRGIHRSPVNSQLKGQWRRALMLSLICAWISGWVNNSEAGDLRRHRTHYDVTVMGFPSHPSRESSNADSVSRLWRCHSQDRDFSHVHCLLLMRQTFWRHRDCQRDWQVVNSRHQILLGPPVTELETPLQKIWWNVNPIIWYIKPYSSGLIHWCWGSLEIAKAQPVFSIPAKTL